MENEIDVTSNEDEDKDEVFFMLTIFNSNNYLAENKDEVFFMMIYLTVIIIWFSWAYLF